VSLPFFDDLPNLTERLVSAVHLDVFLDFDGTLAPLVEHPADASLPAVTRRLLEALATEPNVTLAIISGRAIDDVEHRLGIENIFYSGNHGHEIRDAALRFQAPIPASAQAAMRALAGTLTKRFQTTSGVLVEDKGPTISIHYRLAPEAEWPGIARMVQEDLKAAKHPFRITHGNKVYEIRASTECDKGTACRWLCEQIGQDALPIYVGDDATDEDAFAALPEGITVRVKPSGVTLATHHLDDQADVNRFLSWLAATVKRVGEPKTGVQSRPGQAGTSNAIANLL
jgi:trehalose 6-phosphate phosphatase